MRPTRRIIFPLVVLSITTLAVMLNIGGATGHASQSCVSAAKGCTASPSRFGATEAVRQNQAATAQYADSSQLIDPSSWDTYITNEGSNGQPWNTDGAGGSGSNPYGFDDEYFLPDHVATRDGVVAITATPGSSRMGYGWTSGVLSSYNDFTMDGGYLAVEAKIPNTTDGAWPAIWMMAGPNNPNANEIDLFEGGLILGDNANDNYSGYIHTGGQQIGVHVDTHIDLSAAFHLYSLQWIPGQSVTWYLDGKKIAEVTSKQIPIPTEPLEVVIDLGMASANAGAWHTVSSGSATHTMMVRSIRYASLASPG